MNELPPNTTIDKTINESESEKKLEKYFEAIDKEGTLFAYGSLLDPENLKRLTNESREGDLPEVFEATDLRQASELASQHRNDLIILRNVLLKDIRAQIVTDEQLRRAYEKKFGKDYGPVKPEQYLYVRSKEDNEKSRSVNGGLIMGLSKADMQAIDLNEGIDPEQNDGIYMRKLVPEVEIENSIFKPKNIGFYGGNLGDIHKYLDPKNKGVKSYKEALRAVTPQAGAREEVALGEKKRVFGELPESAYWPHTEKRHVRSRHGIIKSKKEKEE